MSTVLVADDDPTVRSLFSRVLARDGFEVVEAVNGSEVLARVHERPVDVVLLDSLMPVLDGPATLARLRSDEATLMLPVILVTALGDEANRVHGLELGADDYLVKPVSLEELVARVHAQQRRYVAWREGIERDLRTRRAVQQALRSARTQRGEPYSLAASLAPAFDVPSVAILEFGPRRVVLPTSSHGELERRYPRGRTLDPLVAEELTKHAAVGPWTERWGRSWDVAFLPLTTGQEPTGLLVLASREGDAHARLRHRMPALEEAAELVNAFLEPRRLELSVERDRDELRRVIERGAFSAVFQPIVRLADRTVVAYEALTRFDDGVPPDIRFRAAARLGVEEELTLATLRRILAEATVLAPQTPLAVNVSPRIIAESKRLPPALATSRPLILEITEHEAVDDYPLLRRRLAGLRIPLSVDDAGSGYSSLRHILQLAPAFVKLDRSWVSGIDRDRARLSMVAGLVHFSQLSGCQLVAEGIERRSELDALVALGVPLGQGYLLGRPARLESGPTATPTGGPPVAEPRPLPSADEHRPRPAPPVAASRARARRSRPPGCRSRSA